MDIKTDKGVDSKALAATIIMKIPILLVFAVTGAIIGSGLNLVIAAYKEKSAQYVSETKYYIEFAPGIYDAAQYYNDATWNDVIGDDLIMGRIMDKLKDTLKEGYDRNSVYGMITADIVSDVRYLKITIKGDTMEDTKAVEAAFSEAISEFGEEMNEFTSIYKIYEAEVIREKIPSFSVRASFLGALIMALLYLFTVCFNFLTGSFFYSKSDIKNALLLPVYGMTFKNNKVIKEQEKFLKENLKLLEETYESVYFADALDGKCTDEFFRAIGDLGAKGFKKYEAGFDKGKIVIAVIPFGKAYREKIIDVIDNITLRGGSVEGAVLINADSVWYRIYRG